MNNNMKQYRSCFAVFPPKKKPFQEKAYLSDQVQTVPRYQSINDQSGYDLSASQDPRRGTSSSEATDRGP